MAERPIAFLRAPLRRLQRLSVGKKLILIYVFGIFVPLVIANGLVLRSVLADARDQVAAFLFSTVEATELAIRREFEPIELVSESVYADSSIYRLLSSDFPGFEDFVDAHRGFLVPALSKYANVFSGIHRITVYTENPIFQVAAGYLRLDARTRSSEWFRQYTEHRQKTVTIAHFDDDPRTEIEPRTYVSLFRELDNSSIPRTGRLILRIDLNPSMILRHLGAPELAGVVEVVDPWGAVAARVDTPLTSSETIEFDRPFSGSVALSGWSIRGSVAPAVAPQQWSMRWTLLLVVSGFSIAFSSLFILVLSRSVTSRLGRLSAQMHRVDKEDFSPIEVDYPGEDEIALLIHDYNTMARRVESLINDRYKSQIENQQLVVARQQAELDALQSQVNPHFLFNVLESIRMKAHIKGEHETARVVKQVSRSIRRLATWTDDLISLREELDFTREYVEIQQYRFGDRLRSVIEADPQVMELVLPKLTVQGLVENACVHGLEPKTDGGTVHTRARLDGGTLVITVSDDGIGCDPVPVMHELENGRPGSRHIGIANISRRLELHFGDRCCFTFHSEPGSGTTVEIRIREIHGASDADNG